MTRTFIVSLLAAAALTGQIDEPLRVTKTRDISSSATIIDNRSSVSRQNDYHGFKCTGTGTWSAGLEYASERTGPWTSFGSAAVVDQTSNPAIGYGNGYQPFLRINITGSASCDYSGSKGYFTAPSAGGVEFPVTVGQGGTGASTAPAARATLGLNPVGVAVGDGTEIEGVAAGSQGQYLRRKYNTTATEYEFASPTTLISADYNFPAQSFSTTITTPGNYTYTMIPCPLGVAGTNANHYLYLSGGTGTAEAVLINGGTCTSGAASGTIQVAVANAHSGTYTIGPASGGLQEAVCALPSAGGEVIAGADVVLRADVGSCGKTQPSVRKLAGASITGSFSVLEQTANSTLTEWATGSRTITAHFGMHDYRNTALSIVPEAHAPFPPSHGYGLVVGQSDPTKIDPDNFFNGVASIIHTGNSLPYENAAYLGFMFSYGGARPWGGDFHAIVPSAASSVPNLAIGVQAETQLDKAGVAEAYPLYLVHSSSIGDHATSMIRMVGAGAGSDLLMSTDGDVFTGEGIVLQLADATNPTYRAYGLIDHTGTKNLWFTRKDGSMFSRGGFSDVTPQTGGTTAGWNIYRVGEPGSTDTELMNIGADNLYPNSFGISTFKTGTGATRPLIFSVDSSEKFRIDSGSGVLLGQSTRIQNGSGAPEGVVVGNVGDIYLRINGGVGSTMYVKEANNGMATGWAAK